MAPYVEAGDRSLLFAGNVRVHDANGEVVVEVDDPSRLFDILDIHKKDEPMTIESDGLGKVYKNGDSTSGPVSIPKSAIFASIEKSV
jgi:hypothetical protein